MRKAPTLWRGLQRSTVLMGPYSLALTQGYTAALSESTHVTMAAVRSELAGKGRPYGGLVYLAGLDGKYAGRMALSDLESAASDLMAIESFLARKATILISLKFKSLTKQTSNKSGFFT